MARCATGRELICEVSSVQRKGCRPAREIRVPHQIIMHEIFRSFAPASIHVEIYSLFPLACSRHQDEKCLQALQHVLNDKDVVALSYAVRAGPWSRKHAASPPPCARTHTYVHAIDCEIDRLQLTARSTVCSLAHHSACRSEGLDTTHATREGRPCDLRGITTTDSTCGP